MAIYIEDDLHAERVGDFATAEEALTRLKQLESLDAQALAAEIGPTPCQNPHCRRELQVVVGGRVIARAPPSS
ncbi:MAG: hypothetical protein ABI323_03720 [Solirubrobacteraceae bacterium]